MPRFDSKSCKEINGISGTSVFTVPMIPTIFLLSEQKNASDQCLPLSFSKVMMRTFVSNSLGKVFSNNCSILIAVPMPVRQEIMRTFASLKRPLLQIKAR